MDDAYVEAVLAVVETVEPGQVTTYGAIAAAVGRGGRRGGRRQPADTAD